MEFIPGHNQNPYHYLIPVKPFNCSNCQEEIVFNENIYYKIGIYGFTIVLFLLLASLVLSMVFGYNGIHALLLMVLILIYLAFSFVGLYKLELIIYKESNYN